MTTLAEASARRWGKGGLLGMRGKLAWAALSAGAHGGAGAELCRGAMPWWGLSLAGLAAASVLRGLRGAEEQEGPAFPWAWDAASPPHFSSPRREASLQPLANLSGSW